MIRTHELGKAFPQAVDQPASHPTPKGAIRVGSELNGLTIPDIDPAQLLRPEGSHSISGLGSCRKQDRICGRKPLALKLGLSLHLIRKSLFDVVPVLLLDCQLDLEGAAVDPDSLWGGDVRVG